MFVSTIAPSVGVKSATLSKAMKASATAENHLQNQSNLKNVSASVVLAQHPNVSFGARRDSLDAWENYEGSNPPAIEQYKYQLSAKVKEDIDNENYLSALEGKLELAEICNKQGKQRDSYLLENSIRDLYNDLSDSEKELASKKIGEYYMNK